MSEIDQPSQPQEQDWNSAAEFVKSAKDAGELPTLAEAAERVSNDQDPTHALHIYDPASHGEDPEKSQEELDRVRAAWEARRRASKALDDANLNKTSKNQYPR